MFGIFVLVLMLIFPIFVSAQSYGYYSGSSRAFSWIENTLGPVFGYVLGGAGDLLFERVLLFFILVALIFVILKRMPLFKNNIAVIWIVTLSVAFISTRYMSDLSLLKNVLLPYTVLGVALGAGIPFMIYFFFVESFQESSTLRKILWIFFIVVFLGIWADRQQELGELSYIYLLTGMIAVVCLLVDRTIQRAFLKDRIRMVGAASAEDAARKIRNMLYELREDYERKKSISPETYAREKRRLEKELKGIHKL